MANNTHTFNKMMLALDEAQPPFCRELLNICLSLYVLLSLTLAWQNLLHWQMEGPEDVARVWRGLGEEEAAVMFHIQFRI